MSSKKPFATFFLIISFAAFFTATFAHAIFLDGEGHYALRGETRTAPGASGRRGLHQAIDQSFRLIGEGRLNEKSSMFLELRLFDDERSAYLGDLAHPEQCEKNTDCSSSPQNTSHPGYHPYIPKATQAYIRYASDYCIVEAGRRPRSWGMGLFLDAGDEPFSTSHSIFDGISCDINMQKSQTLGISFGFDKLAETGRTVDKEREDTITHGPSLPHDDVNQFFLAIEHDDRKTNAGSSVTKHVGIYAAKILSGPVSKGGLGTDMTFVDLYTGFFIGNIAMQSEVLFRLGKSADPSTTRLGGARYYRDGPAENKMQSIGGTLQAEWTFAKSGSSIGPEEFGRGNATQHQIFGGYTYAPGDSNGYYEGSDESVGILRRPDQAKAIAFHQNFSPALILFNGRKEIDDLAIDGVFDPSRIMNAQLFNFGYRYKDLAFGHFEVQLITASLNETIPNDVYEYYRLRPTKLIGYYDTDLGWELDLKYWRQFGRELDVGIGGAYLLAGKAWQTHQDHKPTPNMLLQTYLSFNF